MHCGLVYSYRIGVRKSKRGILKPKGTGDKIMKSKIIKWYSEIEKASTEKQLEERIQTAKQSGGLYKNSPISLKSIINYFGSVEQLNIEVYGG